MVTLFGSTIKETVNAFKPINFGDEQSTTTKEDKVKVIGRIIVSVMLGLIALYLFTSGSKDLAGTIVGALTGYWMK